VEKSILKKSAPTPPAHGLNSLTSASLLKIGAVDLEVSLGEASKPKRPAGGDLAIGCPRFGPEAGLRLRSNLNPRTSPEELTSRIIRGGIHAGNAARKLLSPIPRRLRRC